MNGIHYYWKLRLEIYLITNTLLIYIEYDTGWTIWGPNARRGGMLMSSSRRPDRLRSPPNLRMKWRVSFPWGKAAEALPPCNAMVKNEWNTTSAPHIHRHWMYRNKFSFAFLDLQFLQRGLKHFKESRPTEFFFPRNFLKLSWITWVASVGISDGAYLLQPSIYKKELYLFVAVQEVRNANCVPTVVTLREPGVLLPVATIRRIAQRTECSSSLTGLNCSLYKVDVWGAEVIGPVIFTCFWTTVFQLPGLGSLGWT